MEEKRQKILDAARDLFLNKGFSAATIDEVADQAGIAKGTVYLYFKNKVDLYVSLLDEKIRLLEQGLRTIAKSDIKPSEKLGMLIEHDLKFLIEHYPGHEFMLDARTGQNPGVLKAIRTRIVPRFESVVRVLAEVLRQGIDQGEFREVDTFAYSVYIFTLVNTKLMRRAMGENATDTAREAAMIQDLILHGVLKTRGVR